MGDDVKAMTWEEAETLKVPYMVAGSLQGTYTYWHNETRRAIALARQERERAERWQEEARMFCENSDFWRGKFERAQRQLGHTEYFHLQSRADALAEAVEADETLMKSSAFYEVHRALRAYREPR